MIYMTAKNTHKRKHRKTHKNHSRKHKRNMRRCSKSYKKYMIIGGDGGATGHGEFTYGTIGQQQSMPNSNVIAMKPLTGGGDVLPNSQSIGGLTPSLVLKGGEKQQGGEVLNEIAVPAVLLALQQGTTRRKYGNKSHIRRHR